MSARADEKVQYLTFLVAGEPYGIRSTCVKEIVEMQELARITGMPASVRGVMNLRGTVTPVIDLARRFGFGTTQLTRRTCTVVVDVELESVRTLLGLMADEVLDVIELGSGDVEAAPSFGTAIDVAYLSGMSRIGERFVMLLDASRVLSIEEIIAATTPE